MHSHDFASTYVGTPYYMSPEICAAERYTLKSDIWSLGCVMYELCTRRPPFDAKTHFQLIQKIKDGRVDPLPSMYSPELQEAIKSCLKTNPHQRPDTADLLSLPIMRLMRKEREVVEIGKTLRLKEDQIALKNLDVEERLANLHAEREQIRKALDDTVRREWEVKARLTIDEHIQAEVDRLRKRFEDEVQARVQSEVHQHLKSLHGAKPASPVSPEEGTSGAGEKNSESDQAAVIDLISLSLDSPTVQKPIAQPVQRKPRGPLARSRTEFDSPADVFLPAPSPMSIDCLSLSPRRNTDAPVTNIPNIPNSKNIFAAAAKNKSRLNPLPSSPARGTSLDLGIMEDSEDDVPEIPSPTRRPSVKAPTRPGLMRQKTAPANRLGAAPTLFPQKKPPRIPSPTNILPNGSPVRKVPPKLASAGGDEMLKAVMQRNMLGQGGAGGRTLVELAQARAGGTQSAAPAVGAKGMMETGEMFTAKRRESEVPVWDPERDEMPSPFLVRGVKGVRRF